MVYRQNAGAYEAEKVVGLFWKKWNFDGYICLQYSLLWGLLGLLAVRYGNDLLLSLYDFLPDAVAFVVVWVLVAVASVDFAGSLMAAWHMQERLSASVRVEPKAPEMDLPVCRGCYRTY